VTVPADIAPEVLRYIADRMEENKRPSYPAKAVIAQRE
jgi:hypothetical protein